MKKRTSVRIISYCLALLLASCGNALKIKNDSDNLKMQINNEYSCAAEELCAATSDIDTVLKKAIYTTSVANMADISAKLLIASSEAKSAVSRLQGGDGEPETLGRFLSQVGNYAAYLTSKLISGNELTKTELENLRILSDTASVISKTVSDALLKYNNAAVRLDKIDSILAGEIPEISLADAVYTLEETVPDYPTLIYDGPYSEPLNVHEARMLKNEEEVSSETALSVAARLTGVSESYLDFSAVEHGDIDAYVFTNGDTSAAVSVYGAHPVYFRKYRKIGSISLSYNQALEKATRFLYATHGVNFKYTYYYEDEGVCVVNFAYREGAVTCYTDLIKIGVAMDNGEIVSFDAKGYLLNHTERAVPTPEYSEDEARQKLSGLLQVISSDTVLIPTESGGEKYCYEFVCNSENGDNVNVYIGTSDLKEQKILIILRDSYGTLTK